MRTVIFENAGITSPAGSVTVLRSDPHRLGKYNRVGAILNLHTLIGPVGSFVRCISELSNDRAAWVESGVSILRSATGPSALTVGRVPAAWCRWRIELDATSGASPAASASFDLIVRLATAAECDGCLAGGSCTGCGVGEGRKVGGGFERATFGDERTPSRPQFAGAAPGFKARTPPAPASAGAREPGARTRLPTAARRPGGEIAENTRAPWGAETYNDQWRTSTGLGLYPSSDTPFVGYTYDPRDVETIARRSASPSGLAALDAGRSPLAGPIPLTSVEYEKQKEKSKAAAAGKGWLLPQVVDMGRPL